MEPREDWNIWCQVGGSPFTLPSTERPDPEHGPHQLLAKLFDVTARRARFIATVIGGLRDGV